jgi:iron complex outermembrane receptor protein
MRVLTCLRRWPALALVTVTCAQAATEPSLADLSLEQLSDIEVTSISKRGQRLAEVAGSVYVIRGEDIRRAGVTSLVEALRLAPNLFVARADAGQYAVTARTGADLLANKLLVQIDGRTIYSPLFSGVFWEAQDLVLEDVDRIEVLSGSGGTLYGSNAFHGVINVITRSADQTTGSLARGVAGADEKIAAGRHGFQLGGGDMRLYAKRVLLDRSRTAGGAAAFDAADRSLVGFRYDRGGSEHQTMVHGSAFTHHAEDPIGHRDYQGFNLLARHAVVRADGARTQWQAYIDRFQLERTSFIGDTLDTLDLDFQHLSAPKGDHLLLWGGGWRHQRDNAENTPAISLLPARRRLNLANLFLQNEWSLDPLKLTLGIKAEHNTYTGMEFLPNVRAAWDVGPHQLLWAAWSRVVRTPARVDREAQLPPLQLSPSFESEVARITELGYRGQVLGTASVSATVFRHDFERLRSIDPAPGGLTFNNNYRGDLTGIEAWTEIKPTDNWRLQAGFVNQKARYSAAPGTSPLPLTQGNDPRTRYNVQSFWDFGGGLDFYLGVRHVASLPQPAVRSYTAIDARVGWQVTPQVELSLLLRNLNGSHIEWGSGPGAAEFRRSALVQAIWRY